MPGKKKRLTCGELIDLANLVTDIIGLKPVKAEKIMQCYKQDDTDISVNNLGLMWISRDYIAYEFDDAVLHYVYITKRYIYEQRRDCCRSGCKARFSDSTAEAFDKAQMAMKETGKDYWVDPQFDDVEETNDVWN